MRAHSTCRGDPGRGLEGTNAGGLGVAGLARQIVAPGEARRPPLGALFQGGVFLGRD